MKTVIYHSADFDGIFCREIAKHFLGTEGVKYIGWNFGDPAVPVPGSGEIIVMDLPLDMTFGGKPGEFNIGILEAESQGSLVWIDHHKSAIESHHPDTTGYRIDGVAACRLAWQWFALGHHNVARRDSLPLKEQFVERTVSEPLAVRLAGEYDIWDKRDPRAEIFQFGLRSRVLNEFDWNMMLSIEKASVDQIEALVRVGHSGIIEPDGASVPAIVCGLLGNGEIIQRYQQQNDTSLVTHKSYRLNWGGLNWLVLNTGRFNSLTFAALDKPETGHDALLGYMFNGKVWTVSLYHAKHRTELDLSQIAVKHGGGGHRGACGFTCDKLPFS